MRRDSVRQSGVRRGPTRTSRAIGVSGQTLLPCSSGVPASATRAIRWASSWTGTVYALDSSTVDLCWSLFDSAPFRCTKAAIKLHTLLDLRGAIPAFIHNSDGKMGDVSVLDRLLLEADAFYVMDRNGDVLGNHRQTPDLRVHGHPGGHDSPALAVSGHRALVAVGG